MESPHGPGKEHDPQQPHDPREPHKPHEPGKHPGKEHEDDDASQTKRK